MAIRILLVDDEPLMIKGLKRTLEQDGYETDSAADGEEAQYLGAGIGRVRHARGCPACNNTGYSGRIAIHEILPIDRELRKMITAGASVEEIKDYAIQKQGMRTLKDCGTELVAQGISTVEELKKVAYYE